MAGHPWAQGGLVGLGAVAGAFGGTWFGPFGAALGALLGALLGTWVARWYEANSATATSSDARDSFTRKRRSRHSDGELRERIIAAIADNVPDAVVLFTDVGTIRYSNLVARNLFFEGQAPEGENFIRLVSDAAAPLREALLGETDRFFSVDTDGQESYYLSRRQFALKGESLTLLVVKHMTREIRRREVEVLKQVVRVVSHEVNNSLAPISSLVHSAGLIARKLGHEDKYQRVFDTINERANHLREFLEGYAALARLPRPQIRKTDWGPLIEQVRTLYPKLRLPQAPSHPGWFDSAQIEQVLINLIKNAYESNGPEQAVELRIVTTPQGESELEVLDRGSGFSDEALRNASLPLYSTKPGGSGMGLALTREIVEAHGGSLEVSNRAEGGASMRVRLRGPTVNAALEASRARLTLTRA